MKDVRLVLLSLNLEIETAIQFADDVPFIAAWDKNLDQTIWAL